MSNKNQRPKWLEEFEKLANERLNEGSACTQIHPIIERWYENLMQGDPPSSRDSILQAIACLSTEILIDLPDEVYDAVVESGVDEEELAFWVQGILMIGRTFQISLDKGELDDL